MKRRTLLLGGTILAVAAAGSAAWKLRLFRKHYPPTPFDDVLARMDDREWAAKFGASVQKILPERSPAAIAARLRARLGNKNLQSVALADAEDGRLMTVDGWLVPESVALMAALAAKLG